MNIINFDKLSELASDLFLQTKPYPWHVYRNTLEPKSFLELVQNMPPFKLFAKQFGIPRKYGQKSHDRWALDYDSHLPIHQAWHDFASELQSKEYREFISELFKIKRFKLDIHWHYAHNGCSISPHCDAPQKIASHVFYFNTSGDWRPTWNGETLILDDQDQISYKSAPEITDFAVAARSSNIGNKSLLFARTDHSWHAMQELTNLPHNYYRKVFIVTIFHLPHRFHQTIAKARRIKSFLPTLIRS